MAAPESLDSAGAEYRDAAKQINTAVVEIHRIAKWNQEEMERMGEVQKPRRGAVAQSGGARSRRSSVRDGRGVDKTPPGGSTPSTRLRACLRSSRRFESPNLRQQRLAVAATVERLTPHARAIVS